MYEYLKVKHEPNKTIAQAVGKLLHKHKAEYVKDGVWKVESWDCIRLMTDLEKLNKPFEWVVFFGFVLKPQ